MWSTTAIKGRGGLGVKVANLVESRGDLVGALMVTGKDEVLCIMASGKVVRSAVAEVSRTGRATQGVTFAKPDEGDHIIAVARNAERELVEDGTTGQAAEAQEAVSVGGTPQEAAQEPEETGASDVSQESAVALVAEESEVEA